MLAIAAVIGIVALALVYQYVDKILAIALAMALAIAAAIAFPAHADEYLYAVNGTRVAVADTSTQPRVVIPAEPVTGSAPNLSAQSTVPLILNPAALATCVADGATACVTGNAKASSSDWKTALITLGISAGSALTLGLIEYYVPIGK